MCSPPSLRFPKRLFVPKVFYPGRSGATRIRPPGRDDLAVITSAIPQHPPLVAHLHRTPPARMPPTMLSPGPNQPGPTFSSACAHRCFYEKAHFVKGQRGGLREATRLAKAPSRCVSIRTPLEPIEGGSVLDGIRLGLRRCHLNLGLPWEVVVAIHPLFAVALGLRASVALGLSIEIGRASCRERV